MVGKGTGSGELTAVREHDAEWARHLSEEADRYFTADKTYEELTKQAGKDAKSTEALLAKAEATLKDVKGKLALALLVEQVDEKLKSHSREAKYIAEEAQQRGKVLGKPAAAWELKDLDGKTHSLEAYRGKVVILDFWYRGCGWCMKAMPQVVQVA